MFDTQERVPLRLRAVAPLFFVSGAVALGCETAYFRGLGVIFGASHQATGALLAAFMAGLAVGSEIGARIADRVRAPVLGYAIAEGIVGLYALVAPAIFARTYVAAAGVTSITRVALAFAILALPTAAMGATLPLLAAAVVRSREALRSGIAALYTVNLAGGVIGALVTGFTFLPRLGLRGTTLVLGGAALAVSIAAIVGARSSANAAGSARLVDPIDASSRARERERESTLAPWIAGAIGVLSFALQVAYNRVLALLLGSSAYTFALVVAVILASTALGGAVSARANDEDATRGIDPFWSKIARRCLALALTVYLGTLVVYVAPFYIAWAAGHLRSMTWVRIGLVVLVVGAPSYQVGALFPALASRFPTMKIGRAAGRAVLVSTLGNVAGALGAAFVTIPTFGVESTLGAVSALALVPALVAAWRAGRAPFVGIAIASVMAAVLSIALRPGWDGIGLSAGSYRVRGYRDQRTVRDDCAGTPFTENRLLFHRDGPVGTVVVLGHAGGASCSLYSLRVNGKAEGSMFVAAPLASRVPLDRPSMPIGDLPSEILAGWLPAMSGPRPRDAMLVGWGTGISARSLLAAGTEHIVAAELEPAVIDAASLFDPSLAQDPRITIDVDDARMVLRRATTASFDVIVSHPSNPWVVGASALFSREYFSLVRDRLRPGGRVLTWIQLYEMDRDAARSLVATFVQAFPDAHAFRVSKSAQDVFLVGIKSSAATSPEALGAVIASRADPDSLAELARAGMNDVSALMRAHLADGDALRAYSEGAQVDTDDRAALEYRIADHVLRGTGQDAQTILRGLATDLRTPAIQAP